jgi:hypothetical protein
VPFGIGGNENLGIKGQSDLDEFRIMDVIPTGKTTRDI